MASALPRSRQKLRPMSRLSVLLLAVFVASATVAPGPVRCADAPQTTGHRCCHQHGQSLVPDTSCCCVTGAPRDAGTPALPRVDIVPQPAPLPTSAVTLFDARARDARATLIQTSPPRSSPISLTTLFGSLLI